MPLSVTIITHNEAANIGAALESVRWADEIIVVDSHSTDQTVAIARKFTDRVIVRDWPGYAAQKQFAAEQAQHEWILSIDADERVTAALASEIQTIIKENANDYNGYYISRQNYYLNFPIKHSGWSPDYQMRLYRASHGNWQGGYVHESVTLAGPAGKLRNKLEHYSIQSLSAHHQRLDRYTSLAAAEMRARGVQVGLADLLLRPIFAWLRSYILRGGWLDGIPGLLIAYFAAHYAFLKYAKTRYRE